MSATTALLIDFTNDSVDRYSMSSSTSQVDHCITLVEPAWHLSTLLSTALNMAVAAVLTNRRTRNGRSDLVNRHTKPL